MSWRSIDFRGILDLDPKIIGQLEQFLQEKESRLAHQILHTVQSLPADTSSPILPTGASLKLSEAVEGFSRKARLFSREQFNHQLPTDNQAEHVVKEVNQGLWEFTEVLEGCVVELFQQVRLVPIDRWHLSIAKVVHSIKDILIHRIEDLIWTIRRLEKPLKEYCQKIQGKPKKWFEWPFFGKGYLDPNLLRNLQQTEKFLKMQYEAFNQHYGDYMLLSAKAEEHLEKMKNYPILALLDVSDQNLYVDVFRLLKMLELNRRSKKEVAAELTQALKQLSSIDHVIFVLRLYYRELKDAFFNSSIEWKSLNQEGENFKDALQKLQGKLKDYQQELRQLIHTMSRYRTFILKNDPNPYIRSRWGFTEWIVGPEPAKAKKLMNMIYSAQELDHNFTQFLESLARDPLTQQRIEYQTHQEIEKILHEMGQPLISRFMMRNRAEKLLEQLKACDEVGSPHMSTIHYFEDVLSQAMREDWKYHVLHEFPLFHQIYRIHQGLVEYFEDPSHAFRLERFRLLFDQIEGWVKKEDIYAHVHEIELDINDMKTYLQDFLASIQRAAKEKSHDPFLDETIHKFRQQLLEYRYLFGQFFSTIVAKSQEGLQLRNQFLFVDQYFESIESLLNELKASWEGKR
jgi:hypothetical protein